MKIPNKLLLSVLLALGLSGAAQVNSLTMSGIVTDNQSRRPIEGAKVVVVGNKAKSDTTTDSEGSFVLNLAQGVREGNLVRIRVEKSGYRPYEKLISVSSAIIARIALVPATPPHFRPANPSIASVRFKHTALVLNVLANTPFVPNKPVSMRVVYENTESVTAKDIRANGHLRFLDFAPGLREREEQEWLEFRQAWISSLNGSLSVDLEKGKTDHFELATDPLSEQDAADLRSEKKLLYFFGALTWKDDSGEYETDICSYFRSSVRGTADAPALWYDCFSGHNAIRKSFQKVESTPAPRVTASVNVEIMPAVDLGSQLAYCLVRMTNVGNLPAKNLNRITLPNVFPSGKPRIFVDQEFINFEEYVKNEGHFGDNTLGVLQSAEARVQLTGISFEDMLDIQAGTKTLYIFMISKYKDERHESLQTKSCVTYVHGATASCDGHNEVP
jgi:hypothetical protein